MSDEPDVTARDALQVAQRALQKANENERQLEELRADFEEVEYELTKVHLRLSEIDDERSYVDLTLDEKIGKVREHAYVRARNGQGTATLDYDDVMWEVFDGKPSADHCYKLLRKAAECRGFTYRTPASRNRHLYVDAREAEKSVAFSSANKTSEEGGRSG